jgi:meso-butanediol dehydrogenase/(S,S)-butanediol dehydrogenase/diacetyl reductase
MVNNAGVGYIMNSTLKLSQDDWDAVLEVNLRGAFFGIKHAAKQMITQGGGGRIISIASQAAKRGFPDLAAYVSSKHALVGLTRTAALEFGAHNITVNTVCPNHITTGLGARQNEFRAKSLGISVDELLATRAQQIPLGRVGKTTDIASTCAFLCSSEADYVTGQNLDVSGGQEMH